MCPVKTHDSLFLPHQFVLPRPHSFHEEPINSPCQTSTSTKPTKKNRRPSRSLHEEEVDLKKSSQGKLKKSLRRSRIEEQELEEEESEEELEGEELSHTKNKNSITRRKLPNEACKTNAL